MEVQERWTFFKGLIMQAQKRTIPVHIKGGKKAKKPSWWSRKIQESLEGKREAYRLWKQQAAAKEEYTCLARAYRETVRTPKAKNRA